MNTPENVPKNLPEKVPAHALENLQQHAGIAENRAPTARTGFWSRTLLSWHALGLLMLPGIFMPLSKGCNGQVVYPIDSVAPSRLSIESVLILMAVFGVPLLVAWVLTLAASLKSRRVVLVQFWLQLTLLVGVFLMFFANEAKSDVQRGELESMVRLILSALPVFIGIPWWIGAPLRRREWARAWGRLQQLTMVGSWILLNLMCLFGTMFLIGYFYTTALMIAVACLAELTKCRLAHDVWDHHAPIERFQFSMARMFLWMSILPLLAAYYRSVDPLVDWLF